MLIRLIYLLAGALVGGVAGAVASYALRRFNDVQVTIIPDHYPGNDPNEDAPLYHGHRPAHEQHPDRAR